MATGDDEAKVKSSKYRSSNSSSNNINSSNTLNIETTKTATATTLKSHNKLRNKNTTRNTANATNVAHTFEAKPKTASATRYNANNKRYQSKIQQVISFSFNSSNFIFITCILSISKLCSVTATPTPPSPTATTTTVAAGQTSPTPPTSAAPTSAAAAAATSSVTATLSHASDAVAANFLMQNFTSSLLMEKLLGNTTYAPSSSSSSSLSSSILNMTKAENNNNTSNNSINSNSSYSDASTSSFSIFNNHAIINRKGKNTQMEFSFLNVSGKIGTPLGIAQTLTNKCDEKQFQCANGDCIPIRFVCDGDPDCLDHSDEAIAECKFIESQCLSDQFRCNNGKCIPNKWRCDQENDCADGSDEAPALCINFCAHNEVKCKNGEQCIPRSWVCDGSADCRDKSDEADCKEKPCSPDEYTCKSGEGECVPLTWLCDQSNDCSDASDEIQCNQTCRSDEFTCANGRCIQKRWICDYDNDCGDFSDENNCPKIPCNANTDFTCTNGACITKRWVCDGDPDCADGSDERSCRNVTKTVTPCLAHEYQCKDRLTCLHQSWLCDGERDCPDGDDESTLNCKNTTCRADQFQCGDRSCIAGHLTCNGQNDCTDNSDEKNCHIEAELTVCNTTTQFDCGGGQCIALSKVCDRRKDCPDGEDEPAGKCAVNECSIHNGGCMHKCLDQQIGYSCSCDEGYKLGDDNHTCIDVNECEDPSICSQSCINEIGGYKCECFAGYMRDPRNHTRCKATEGHASLLLARRHDIRKIALDHMEMTSIVNNTKSATALDFVFRTGMIFWSDVTTQSIYKAPIDEGYEKTIVLKEHSVTSDGLAVDWIYNHVYFTDTHKCTIELTNFDGNMGKVLIEDELDIPRSIALDPLDGWMYWSDWGASPRIERAGMDGSQRSTIISYDVRWPNGITLDLVRKRLYWVDGKLNTISSANYDGTQRKQILYSTEYLRHPFSITTFEDNIYWTDWDKQTVFKANKFNGEGVEAITAVHMLQHPMVIHVYHPYRQPDGINHCQTVNGHCSHLCLPAPRLNERSPRISCGCPTGLKLMADGLMCVEDPLYVKPRTPRPRASNTRPKHRHPHSHTSSSPYRHLIPEDAPHLEAALNVVEDHALLRNGTHNDDNIHAQTPQEADSGRVAVVVTSSLAASSLILAVLLFMGYRYCSRRRINSMNFENPIYRKTTEDHFNLRKNLPARIYDHAGAMEEEYTPVIGISTY